MSQFVNRLSESFYREAKQDYRLKLILNNQKPMVGISVFYQNGTNQGVPNWKPGKKHFFMPIAAWKELVMLIPEFAREVDKGAFSNLHRF